MMMKNNAKCSICGKEYYMCLSCKDTAEVHPFKKFTDTAEHYKVFQIIKGYNTSVYTKEEAKAKLKKVDLSDLETFRPHIKEIINDLLKEEPVIEPIVEEIQIERPVAIRKRSYKAKNDVEETELFVENLCE